MSCSLQNPRPFHTIWYGSINVLTQQSCRCAIRYTHVRQRQVTMPLSLVRGPSSRRPALAGRHQQPSGTLLAVDRNLKQQSLRRTSCTCSSFGGHSQTPRVTRPPPPPLPSPPHSPPPAHTHTHHPTRTLNVNVVTTAVVLEKNPTNRYHPHEECSTNALVGFACKARACQSGPSRSVSSYTKCAGGKRSAGGRKGKHLTVLSIYAIILSYHTRDSERQ